jgi:hypothetical protein
MMITPLLLLISLSWLSGLCWYKPSLFSRSERSRPYLSPLKFFTSDRSYRNPSLIRHEVFKNIYSFEQIKEAIDTYNSTSGHINIPYNYSIPLDDERFPSTCRGIKLGAFVSAIRNRKQYAAYQQKLGELGYVLERKRSGYTLVKDALLVYKELHGHVDVPQKYVIAPDDERYPEHVRGFKLGLMISMIRSAKSYKTHTKELVELGFQFDRKRNVLKSFEQFIEVLSIYKSIHGDLRIPSSYRIPRNDENYPENVRGLQLGKLVMRIRNKGQSIAWEHENTFSICSRRE